MDQDLPAPTNTIKCAEMHINIENGNFSFFCFHCIGAVEIRSFVEICSHIENIHFSKPGNDDPVEISDDEESANERKGEIMRQENTEFINMQDIIDDGEIQVEDLIDGEQLANNFGKSDMEVDIVGSTNFDLKQDSFKCTLCTIDFIGKDFLDSHVKAHEKSPMLWTCEFCPKKYSVKNSYVSHRRKSHRNEYSINIRNKKAVNKDVEVAEGDSQETTYSCKICESKFTNRSCYRVHLRKKHKLYYAEEYDNDNRLQDVCKQCKICKMYYMYKDNYENHLKAHQAQESPMIWHCEQCAKQYTNRDMYMRHRRLDHQLQYAILQEMIDIKFKGFNKNAILQEDRDLKIDVLEKNGTSLCKLCGIWMETRFYESHNIAHQEMKMIWQCEYCYKSYDVVHAYHRHRNKLHTTENVVVLKPLLFRLINKYKNITHQDDDAQSNVNKSDFVPLFSENKEMVVYDCSNCNLFFQEKASYEQHMMAHDATEMIWKCEDCDEIYRRRDDYFNHRLVKHQNLGKKRNRQCLTCDMCNRTFSTRSKIIQHFNVHITECKQCNIVFSSRKKLLYHNSRHHRTTINYECELCDEKFCKRYLLQIHMSTVHPEAIQSIRMHCSICRKRFTNHKLLKEHLTREHGNSKFVQCSLCPSKFKSNKSLNYHIVNKHTDDANKLKYTCDICQNSYTHISYLKVHKRIHAGVKPFVCTYCGKQFYGQSSLTTHVKQIHLKLRYKCNYCDKIFTQSDVRNSHELRHTNPQLRYSCETCGKIFASRQVLRNHVYLHQEKRYQCKFCDMKFSQSSGRRGHERSVHKAI